MSHVQQTLCIYASFNHFTLMDLLSLFYGCTTLGGITPCLSNNDNNSHDDPIYQKNRENSGYQYKEISFSAIQTTPTIPMRIQFTKKQGELRFSNCCPCIFFVSVKTWQFKYNQLDLFKIRWA